MIRAVIKAGTIHPMEPIPPEWSDGREVVVQDAEPCRRPEDIDRWYQELEATSAAIDPEDDQRLQDAVPELKRQAKEMARREMGLT